MMKRLLALACLAAMPMAAHAADSAYTPFSLDNCEDLIKANPEEPGGDFISVRCKGYKDNAIIYKEGDLRLSAFFGHPSQAIIDEGFETFSPFNNLSGGKLEWRVDEKGQAYATIYRVILANMNPDTGEADDAHRGEVLVISRVATKVDGMSCVVGYVDALSNKDANAIARKVADDLAPGFACGKTEPTYHGTRGPNAAGASHTLPGQQ